MVPQQPSGLSSAVRGQATEGGLRRNKVSLREQAALLVQPPKKVGPSPTVWQSIRTILFVSYLNVLLICIPISWALDFALPNEHALIFVFSFLAIVPLSKLLAFATEDLSIRVGRALADLMNITLGNAVEMIIAIIALVNCEPEVVRSSLVGSVLSNLLLVLGVCFFAGGLRFSEQGFGIITAHVNSALLTISVIAVLLPAAFVMALQGTFSTYDSAIVDQSILKISLGIAIILLFVYASFLLFQFFSHGHLYQDDDEDILESKRYGDNPLFKIKKFHCGKRAAMPQFARTSLVTSPPSSSRLSAPGDGTARAAQPTSNLESCHAAPMLFEEETEDPQMSVPVSVGLSVVVTVVVVVTARSMVDSISGLTESGGISKEFIGVILLPLIGDAAYAAERASAVTVSVKDKLTLSLGVAVSSSIQVMLFVIPFIVTLGWILGKPLTLLFDPLQSIVMFFSVLTVNCIVQTGQSNWLKGVVLICLYLIVCVTFWYYPGTNLASSC